MSDTKQQQSRLKTLISKGKEQGYLTYAEVLKFRLSREETVVGGGGMDFSAGPDKCLEEAWTLTPLEVEEGVGVLSASSS